MAEEVSHTNSPLEFVRKFRFIIYGEHLASTFNRGAEIDWLGKTLKLSAYEVFADGCVPIIDWATAMQENKYPDETLTLVALDTYGKQIYAYRFSGLVMVSRTNSFEYSSSDINFHNVRFMYGNCEPVVADLIRSKNG